MELTERHCGAKRCGASETAVLPSQHPKGRQRSFSPDATSSPTGDAERAVSPDDIRSATAEEPESQRVAISEHIDIADLYGKTIHLK